MKHLVRASVLALIGVGSSSASAAWGLRFEVSTDNGATWSSGLFASPGDLVQFRFGAYFDPDSAPVIATADGTGTALALNRFTGSNEATHFIAGDAFQNVTRTISQGDPSLVQVAGSTIGGRSDTSFGDQVFLGDIPLETYTEIYRGELKISATKALRIIEIRNKTFGSGSTAGLTFFNSVSAFNKQSGAPKLDGPGRADWAASIYLLPAPGSLALLSLGGLVAARRRRA